MEEPRQSPLRIGPLALTGPAALLVALALLALFVALVVRIHPSPRMLASGLLWLAFIVYWSAAARDRAAATSTEAPGSRRIHEILLNGSILVLLCPVPWLTGRFVPLSAPLVASGFAVQGVSFALAVWARRHLGRNWSGAIAVAVGHQLVRTGPYRFVRHPIYTAMFGMFLGTAAISGEYHALLAIAILGVAYARKIPMEERTLRETFGPGYDAYRRESRALIPWVL